MRGPIVTLPAILPVDSWLHACQRKGLITELQGEVMRLLMNGHTDDAVARKLCISTRSVQRHVTKFMALTGARSRLELGGLLVSMAEAPGYERRHLR
jgi:DNA-binding NarL/FixJ family response regulator